ncbi:MAG: polysaccharide deacetylase family protein [Candidatus Saccharimonas sp.]
MSAVKFEQQIDLIRNLGSLIVSTKKELDDYKHVNKTFFMITFDDAYNNFYDFAYPILSKYQIKSVLFVPTAKVGLTLYEQDYDAYQRYMTLKQLKYIQAEGLVNIQSHGHSHIPLGKYSNLVQQDDIERSNLYLHRNLNIIDTGFFCLPYGSSNSGTYDILASMKNIEYIFTTDYGINDILPVENASLIRLKRIVFRSSIELNDFHLTLESL